MRTGKSRVQHATQIASCHDKRDNIALLESIPVACENSSVHSALICIEALDQNVRRACCSTRHRANEQFERRRIHCLRASPGKQPSAQRLRQRLAGDGDFNNVATPQGNPVA